ncbi:MAG: aminotransferase class V-fold PLP-dependent enzyme [Candidatus Binatia bacterium]
MSPPGPSPHAALWTLDPSVTYLNHGAFGACPRPVLAFQQELRARLERQPVQFMQRDLEGLLDEARLAVGAFVGAVPSDLAFVANATSGVNAVLRSLVFAPGDELLTTDHAYGACRNALHFVAERSGATVVTAKVPFPIDGPDAVIEAVLARVTPRTRLAVLDHVTSPTGLVFPIADLVRVLAERGVEALVDGAHAVAMVPLDLSALGAAYYAGNCHKWLCAPKSVGFLHVRRDVQEFVRPLAISHGARLKRPDRSRFLLEFDWTGTVDPTAALSIPEAIRVLGAAMAGGWPAIREHNRNLALAGRRLLAETLGIPEPAPASMIGSLAALPIADGPDAPQTAGLYRDALQDALREEAGIEVPLVPWPAPPRRLIRIAAALYNTMADYERLAVALPALMARAAA